MKLKTTYKTNIADMIPHHIRILSISTFLLFSIMFLLGQTIVAHAQQQNFMPLRSISKAIMPGGFVDPRFRRGGHRVNFFVSANELPSLLDPELSTACALGQFTQKKKRRNFINIRLDNGRVERFGFATANGFNLKDKDGLKQEGTIYLFYLDGSSECRVYGIAR